jgi:hypothetical protein
MRDMYTESFRGSFELRAQYCLGMRILFLPMEIDMTGMILQAVIQLSLHVAKSLESSAREAGHVVPREVQGFGTFMFSSAFKSYSITAAGLSTGASVSSPPITGILVERYIRLRGH